MCGQYDSRDRVGSRAYWEEVTRLRAFPSDGREREHRKLAKCMCLCVCVRACSESEPLRRRSLNLRPQNRLNRVPAVVRQACRGLSGHEIEAERSRSHAAGPFCNGGGFRVCLRQREQVTAMRAVLTRTRYYLSLTIPPGRPGEKRARSKLVWNRPGSSPPRTLAPVCDNY